jgi:uncharacterized protein YdiU (UPF0061 family)
MDYGPFGFLEEYSPVFAKWTGSGQHFGFMNQPSAGFANYKVLVESVVPVICAAKNPRQPPQAVGQEYLDLAVDLFNGKVLETFRTKLGFEADQDAADDLWDELEPLMRKSRVDWTLFWRELTYLVRDFADAITSRGGTTDVDYDILLTRLEGSDEARAGSSPFYEPLRPELRAEWMAWIIKWREALAATGQSGEQVFERMRTNNPKFVLREWMLVNAYTAVAKGEEAELFYLNDLIQRPYEEGSENEIAKYYRRAPEEALWQGGTAFMS